jgi:hypothetical protein
VIGGSLLFNIFTARFMKLRQACEATKSNKPVFLCKISFAEANQLYIRDEISSALVVGDAEDDGFKPDGIGVGKTAYSGVTAV